LHKIEDKGGARSLTQIQKSFCFITPEISENSKVQNIKQNQIRKLVGHICLQGDLLILENTTHKLRNMTLLRTDAVIFERKIVTRVQGLSLSCSYCQFRNFDIRARAIDRVECGVSVASVELYLIALCWSVIRR